MHLARRDARTYPCFGFWKSEIFFAKGLDKRLVSPRALLLICPTGRRPGVNPAAAKPGLRRHVGPGLARQSFCPPWQGDLDSPRAKAIG